MGEFVLQWFQDVLFKRGGQQGYKNQTPIKDIFCHTGSEGGKFCRRVTLCIRWFEQQA